MEEENKDQIKSHESFKESYSNVVSQLQKVNSKVEVLEELEKCKINLENKH